MQISLRRGALALLGSAVLLSCTDNPSSPRAVPTTARRALAALPAVRFSEIHYDNTGTDAGEAIEIEGPEGATLTGFSIVLAARWRMRRYSTSARSVRARSASYAFRNASVGNNSSR